MSIAFVIYDSKRTGLLNVFNLFKEFGYKCFALSLGDIVDGQSYRMPEEDVTALMPADTPPYGASNFFAEELVHSLCATTCSSGLSLLYFNPIGAHESVLFGELPNGVPQNLAPFIAQKAAGIREKLSVYGSDYPTADGSAISEYTIVVDLVEAHDKALIHLMEDDCVQYDVYNISTVQGTSALELTNVFEEANEVSINYEIVGRRMGDIVEIFANRRKADRLMGWKARLSVEQAPKNAWNREVKLKENNRF